MKGRIVWFGGGKGMSAPVGSVLGGLFVALGLAAFAGYKTNDYKNKKKQTSK